MDDFVSCEHGYRACRVCEPAVMEAEEFWCDPGPWFPPNDPINSPPHYTYGDIEVIDAIEAWGLGYHRGNIVKYLARAGRKGGPEDEIKDLRKAAWYLEREISRLEGK